MAISNHEDHGADNDSRNHGNPLIKKIMVQTMVQTMVHTIVETTRRVSKYY